MQLGVSLLMHARERTKVATLRSADIVSFVIVEARPLTERTDRVTACSDIAT